MNKDQTKTYKEYIYISLLWNSLNNLLRVQKLTSSALFFQKERKNAH